jgi:hypothetical protein
MELELCGSYLVYNIYPKWIEPYETFINNNFKLYYTYSLSINPNSINYLEKNPDKKNWYALSKNENAVEMIKKEILKSNSKIIWKGLSSNSNSEILIYLKNNPEKIDINGIYHNKNPDILKIIGLNINKNKLKILNFNKEEQIPNNNINWYELSKNKYAISILKKNPNKIKWKYLSYNKNPDAIKLIRERLLNNKDISEFDWIAILKLYNYDAIELIKENINEIINYFIGKNNFIIFIDKFFRNPIIFTVNYEYLKNRINIILEELMMVMFHPKNINKFKDWGFSNIL